MIDLLLIALVLAVCGFLFGCGIAIFCILGEWVRMDRERRVWREEALRQVERFG